MEVRPDFKPSEVGVIPADWYTRPCSAISDLITVGIVVRPTQYYAKQGVPALRSANIREDGIDDQDMVFISEKANALLSKSQVRTGDVLTVRTGYPGTSAVVPPSFAGSNCIDILITRPSKAVNSHYLSAWINSSLGKYQVLRDQGGLAQQHFNVGDLRNLVVALPPMLAEQEAIAEALRNTEALIESLEQLLAKKRQIKQGAMQELLTGKNRLPGFSGEWEVVNAGDIGRFRGGSGFPTKFQGATSGKYPFFKVSDMNNERNETFMETANNYISEARRKQLGAIAFPAHSIVFAKVGAAVFLERKKILAKASCLDNNMAAFVLDASRADCRFIHYLLLNTKLSSLVSTTALPSFSGSVLAAIEFVLPPPAEQTAIAAILCDMDAEIASLEAKLAKARHLKQGMMQELLKGRIRLV